jgi:hypothetical protein
MIKKFYVGAKHIGAAIAAQGNAACTRDSIEEAISDAREMVRRGEVQTAVIVKIVAVVRKEYPPIAVDFLD